MHSQKRRLSEMGAETQKTFNPNGNIYVTYAYKWDIISNIELLPEKSPSNQKSQAPFQPFVPSVSGGRKITLIIIFFDFSRSKTYLILKYIHIFYLIFLFTKTDEHGIAQHNAGISLTTLDRSKLSAPSVNPTASLPFNPSVASTATTICQPGLSLSQLRPFNSSLRPGLSAAEEVNPVEALWPLNQGMYCIFFHD